MTGAVAPNRARVESVDVLRGIVMVLMALDHVRDYFGDLGVSPTNLATTTAPLFFTRWVTYVCAPVFFLLTGTGAYLALRRMTKPELSRFLITRGLWLIFLEFVFVRFALQFNFDYRLTVLTVMWALGWAMIVLGLLVHLPTWAVTAVGMLMIAGHNLLDGMGATLAGALGPLWNVLHQPGFLVNTERVVIFIAYPLVPWIGVTAVGYGLGQLYAWSSERRQSVLLWTGAALTLGYVVLRAINMYGDPSAWAPQQSPIMTLVSFLNTTKYPPSLQYLLMTLGPSLLILGALDRTTPSLLRPVLTIGRVPLFYYVLHFTLIHLLAVLASAIRFGDIAPMFQSPTLDKYPITQVPGWPLGLGTVYAIWIGVVVALYPACRWFAELRRRRTEWWLSYL